MEELTHYKSIIDKLKQNIKSLECDNYKTGIDSKMKCFENKIQN